MKRVLIHVCCAPCFTYIENDIRYNGIKNKKEDYEKVDYTALFYNPNIQPKVEYKRRKEAFEFFCKLKGCKYDIIDEYNLDEFVRQVVNNTGDNKKYKVRCEYCYYNRLRKVFEYAKVNGFDAVSTTLTISPYQNHDIIKKVSNSLEEEFGIEFWYNDYTKHFREGQKMAREIEGMYMQKYCGCIFSIDSGRWVY